MEICDGQGWRLVVDPTRSPYPALIGGEAWASELSGAELIVLRRGVMRLVDQHRDLAEALMAEEALDLEFEQPIGDGPGSGCGSLWLGLSGDRHHWSLRLVLTPAPGSRAVEGAWDSAASRAIAAALEGLRLSEHDQENQDC
ncbi:DUF1818 family protein [Synechococcus sp. CCY 9618]|uniref:DUF1818 family protein n=1 Tax=Synechococcus sp. CCY 9618 TaxID=2815602 RepID=UPI001C21018C